MPWKAWASCTSPIFFVPCSFRMFFTSAACASALALKRFLSFSILFHLTGRFGSFLGDYKPFLVKHTAARAIIFLHVLRGAASNPEPSGNLRCHGLQGPALRPPCPWRFCFGSS